MKQFSSYEEENIHYWTNRAAGYSGVNQEELATDQKQVWGRTISRKIAARFPGRAPESLRILDVGTGPGFFAILLAGMGYQVTAVDYTASMLEEAKHNAGKSHFDSAGCLSGTFFAGRLRQQQCTCGANAYPERWRGTNYRFRRQEDHGHW